MSQATSETISTVSSLVTEARRLRAESLEAAAAGVEHRVRERLKELDEVEDITQAAVARSGRPDALLAWQDLLSDTPLPPDRDRLLFLSLGQLLLRA